MLKNYTHDYAVAAFAFYAKCGCPSDEELHHRIYKWAEKNHDSLEMRNRRRKKHLLTEEDLTREKAAVLEEQLSCYIGDIEAVNKMLSEISAMSMGEDRLRCIRYIYFTSGVNLSARGNMSALVQRCTMDTGLNESFIYRNLRLARETFMLKRGLRYGGDTAFAEDVFMCG